MDLKATRLKAGLTQEELAELAGVEQVTISSLETGRTAFPSWETACRLASALKIEPTKLFPYPDSKASA